MGTAYAQDTLYSKNGTVTAAKVIEVGQNEIRYVKSSNMDGPVYTVEKSDVAAIQYRNGSRDVFTGSSGSNAYQNQGAYPPNGQNGGPNGYYDQQPVVQTNNN